MRKLIILLLLFLFVSSNAQKYDRQWVDSVTYKHYLNGSWDSLISVCRKVYKTSDIDFMYLRQRLGYAYFMKQNYALSKWHYEHALKFAPTDQTSLYYLYLNGVYAGDDSYARFFARKLDKETQTSLRLHAFRILNSADAEYNYKTGADKIKLTRNQTFERSGTNYVRIGLGSQPGYRLSLYQSVSSFNQTFNGNTTYNQKTYYALLSYSLSSSLTVSAGFHYLNTSANDTATYNNTLLLAKLSYSKHRFDVSVSGSVYGSSPYSTSQLTMHGGVLIPELRQLYLYGDYSILSNSGSTNGVYKFGAGFFPLKKLWLELYHTGGTQLNFNDLNGLYIYNSLDYSTSKTGVTALYYLTKNLSLVGNYSYENKVTSETISRSYNQHAITGGMIWKF